MPETSPTDNQSYDPASDVPRLLIKVGALTMRNEELNAMVAQRDATITQLRGALIQMESLLTALRGDQTE